MKDTDPIIDIPSRGGLRGRIDKLCEEYTLKAQALKLVAAILDADDRAQAVQNAPKKFLQAINQRNGDERHLTRERRLDSRTHGEKQAERVATYLAAHPGVTTPELVAGLDLSTATVLKYVQRVGKPLVKRPRGSKQPWQWIAKAATTTLDTTVANKRKAGRATRGVQREPAQQRRADVAAYLTAHPGATIEEMAVGLGWKEKQVRKFAAQVATAQPSLENYGARRWFVKVSSPATTPRVSTRQPSTNTIRAQRQERLRTYLAAHPETYTVQLAKVVGVSPNSGFVKLLRTIAKPARETIATQPIPWVLT